MQHVFVAPRGDLRGGLVVAHGGTGLGDHEREQCERFAELGFAAFAPDLFGETLRDRAHGMAVIGALVAAPHELRARMAAAHRALLERIGGDVPVAAVGHCFGGLAVLELARGGADLRAVASVHGGLATTAPATAIKPRVLICTGAADPYANAEARAAISAELEAAGADWQMLVLGGARHGFTLRGDAYDDAANRHWWRSLLGLLDDVAPARRMA